ncbi:MAG TPA: serine/threonine-protein kinase [Acidobacteriota bacterium]|nr:serine/threonine-protein kinase [Acidobacteriota bacterium]
MNDHDIERQIFHACLELPASQRSPYLREACRDRPELEQRIRSLLAAAERPFLDQPLYIDWDLNTEPMGSSNENHSSEAKPYCLRCQNTLVSNSLDFCPECGHRRPTRGWPRDNLLGKIVAGGQYRVIRRLGSGGFGVVYEIETVIGGLRRALKVLKEDWAQDNSVRGRFINEAVALEKINHPNVARCFAAGTLGEQGDLYLLFELIDGIPLSALFASSGEGRGLEPLRAVRIARQVASGLAAAHAKNILHRDLKPANVMVLDDGTGAETVKLLDFGIAKFIEADASWTAGLVGTPAFMAPEQFSPDAQVTAAADLWQLGALLFFLLTGRPPYTLDQASTQPAGQFYRERGQPGPCPAEIEPRLAAHPALDQFVGRLLSTAPEDRPATATEVCEELTTIEQSLSPYSSEPGPTR